MVSLRLSRDPCLAALTAILMVLSSPVALVRDTRPRFLHQIKCECHFSNGTEWVRFLERHIYNQEEHLRFDSDIGEYRAVTKLGQVQAEYWNSQKDLMEQTRGEVDTYCRFNYGILKKLPEQQREKPQVTVHSSKTQHLQHHNLLVCSVSGFYPSEIKVTWFRNGQEEKAGVVSTGRIRNGDWTFQTLVMLETVPQSGDVYTCQVEHASLPGPVAVEWRGLSGSAQSKVLSGVGGCVLGLLFLGVGLFIYFRNVEGQSGLQLTGNERPSALSQTGLLPTAQGRGDKTRGRHASEDLDPLDPVSGPARCTEPRSHSLH